MQNATDKQYWLTSDYFSNLINKSFDEMNIADLKYLGGTSTFSNYNYDRDPKRSKKRSKSGKFQIAIDIILTEPTLPAVYLARHLDKVCQNH